MIVKHGNGTGTRWLVRRRYPADTGRYRTVASYRSKAKARKHDTAINLARLRRGQHPRPDPRPKGRRPGTNRSRK